MLKLVFGESVVVKIAVAMGLTLGFINSASAQYLPEPNPPVLQPTEVLQPPVGEVFIQSITPTLEWTNHKSADGLHPDGDEQKMMWLMNRARQNPTAEGVWLAESTHADIERGRTYFGVDINQLKSAFTAIAAKPPAAFDVRLYNASRDHSLDLIARNAQDHTGQNEKVAASGFACNGGRISVFSYARSALNSHAALNIDWGYDSYGMQDPPGHRYAIMDVDVAPLEGVKLSNVGLALVPENDPATDVGSLVFSGAYCQGGMGEHNRFIVGTVWRDLNANQEYDSGEGMSGVTVMPDSGTYYAITGRAGGYSIPITSSRAYTVSFSGGGFATSASQIVVVGNDSVLLDLLDSDVDGTPDASDAFPYDPAESLDTDGDTIGNNADTDDDGDGMPDLYEENNGLNPVVADATGDLDGDGLTNLQELQLTSDPQKADTDGDGLEDGYEIANDLNPVDSTDCPSWICITGRGGWRAIMGQ